MRQVIQASNWTDADGNPTGGTVRATGMFISWQEGPLGRHGADCTESVVCDKTKGCTRKNANGAFVEGVIQSAIQRLEFFQAAAGGRFECHENTMALNDLKSALGWLDERSLEREHRSVEGTHQP